LNGSYDAAAEEGDIVLAVTVSEKPIFAAMDRALMQRAVGNLISNAIAHTPPKGRVTLSACQEDGADIRIEVADTGCGIAAEFLTMVFDRFYRGDPSRSQASGGTGLGLPIVQGIIGLHGGEAAITSQPGEGTRVTLRLPPAP
jgi:two-component system heavy metal sensor histidine kinase CusS